MQQFEGRVAVVTGAGSGIGLAMARRFAQEGMRVVLGDFDGPALDAAVEALTQEEHEVLGVQMDVLKDEDVERLRDEAVERFGGVHVLCNNAGVIDSAAVPVWESTQADWDWVFGTNFDGVLRGIRAFVPTMVAQDEPGHVVNTASVAGLIAGSGIYGVSKHAVVALSETLNANLQVEGRGGGRLGALSTLRTDADLALGAQPTRRRGDRSGRSPFARRERDAARGDRRLRARRHSRGAVLPGAVRLVRRGERGASGECRGAAELGAADAASGFGVGLALPSLGRWLAAWGGSVGLASGVVCEAS